MSLCKNRSSRYRHVFSVSLYNGTVWYVDVSHRIEIWLELVSVDYDVSGTHFETVECELHSRYGCVEDIDSVDFFGLHHHHGPCKGLFLYHGTEPGTH